MDEDAQSAVESDVLRHLEATYGISGTISTAQLGVNWTLRVVEDGQPKAYVRLYRCAGRSAGDIAAELEVLAAVRSTAALNVPRPLCDLKGRLFSELTLSDGVRRFVGVFSPSQGRPLADTAADYHLVGRALADLHQQRELERLVGFRVIPSEAAPTLAQIAERSERAANTISRSIRALRKHGAAKALGPIGFCHGDVRASNMQIQDDGCLGLFDFDDCGRGPQLLDLAAVAFWLEVGDHAAPAALWNAFLEGYGKDKTPSLVIAIRFLIIQHQIRIIKFLLDYCILEENLWSEVLNEAARLSQRAGHGILKIWQ